jgi:hypothetical protein
MKKIGLYLLALIVPFLWQCKEDDVSESETTLPPVTIVSVKNFNGGSIVYYSLPNQPNLKEVKTVYAFTEGNTKEIVASAAKDSVVIEGAPEAKQYEVSLTLIDKAGNVSEITKATINPLTPPILLIKESMEVTPVISGLDVVWKNRFEEPISLSFYEKKGDGQLQLLDSKTSNVLNGKSTLTGLESVEKQYVIVIQDRWKNDVTAVDAAFTPLPEPLHPDVVLFDRSELRVVKVSAGSPNNNMFDGNENTMYHSYFNEWWTPENKPFYVVVDLTKVRHVAKIELYRRHGADSPDTKTVKFYVGDDSNVSKSDGAVEPEGVGTVWTSIGQIMFENNDKDNFKKTLDIEEFSSRGRYLLLFFPDSWNTHANVTELYLYGWDL